jgi:hypothetical protein
MGRQDIQIEILDRENLLHYFEQTFVTYSNLKLDVKDYQEIQEKLEQLVKEKTNGK